MDFTLNQEIPAPVDAVDEALVNPDFLTRMAELPKLGSAEVVGNERDGDTVKVQVRYLFQAELSAAVTRFVDPKKLTWVEDSTCDLAAHHTTCVIRRTTTTTCSGELRGADRGRGRRAACGPSRGRIKVHVPLLGGKVEKAIIGGLSENADAQTTLLTEFISG